MRNISFCVAILCLSVFSAMGQSMRLSDTAIAPIPKFYLGGGIGLNDFGIIGISGELPLNEKYGVFADLGQGGWGSKIGGGGVYYFKRPNDGGSVSFGVSYASGIDSIQMELAVKPIDKTEKVDVQLLPVTTVNIKYGYAWGFGRQLQNKFIFSVGYAVKVTDRDFNILTDDTEINDQSKQIMEMGMPGGLILGGKLVFGIGRN